jgi:hypothetical protein
MLKGHAKCHHVNGMDAIMSSCDGSILGEIPNDVAMLAACTVKRLWSTHGFPYVTNTFRVEPEVRLLCCVL